MTVGRTNFHAFTSALVSVLCLVLVALRVSQVTGQLLDTEFQPTVTATCKSGHMTIRVNLNQSFVGAVHARDFRTPQCMAPGNGSTHATLAINLLAPKGSPDYCGVLVNNDTEERSIPIAVRIHKTLELADDKFYVITCGKAGFKNAKNETSLVSLRLLDGGHKVQEAIYGHNYTLRAEISRPDGMYGIKVKSCFAFNKRNSSVQLIDDKGCPVKAQVMTKFIYDRNTGLADATLFSMFRFSDSTQVHFQCDIAVCRGSCGIPVCDDDNEEDIKGASLINRQSVSGEEGVLLAGTSVFVLNPGQTPSVQSLYEDGSVHPVWLLWLAVALGILFLIMLIINIFLCSAMTCSCTRTDIIEKEPSIIEDYDPYRSWHGSQYGSRYSLNGKQGYASGGSTMNSTRSISTNSDHYAIVHSRPGSRYSGPGQKHHHHHRGPPSNIGSHYSGK
ncbi:uncharacterized protein LOC122721057 [Apis laboriosa]|uniref:uncharacterized protein LOC102681459 n=1 Tax=Apis dorsata TaxID=7462 RepID=UPI0003DF69D5|nr:uncharacterized protein LOC102681459 [Apis dorsata]XP_043804210.1 uncharacterized protein LOC122721057 [Apis laboriosa]